MDTSQQTTQPPPTFQGAAQPTTQQPVDQQALTLTHAIALQESGNNGKPNYNAVGDNGTSKGAYQWQPGNFEAAAKSAGLDPTDFSPENQDKVAYSEVKGYKDKGYDPGQIASLWNSGSPNNWQNHSGTTTINGKQISYDTPAYVKGVQKYYNQLTGSSGQNQSTDPTQTTSFPSATQTPDSTSPSQPGFLSSLFKGIASPVATMLARPFQAGAELLGASDTDVNNISNKLSGGLVAPVPENGADLEKDVGRGAETVALGLGPVAGGTTYGIGNSLEQGNKLFSGQTALQGAVGAVGGKVLDAFGKPILDAAGSLASKVLPQSVTDAASAGLGAVGKLMDNTKLLPDAASNAINKGADVINNVAEAPFNKAGSVLQNYVTNSTAADWERQATTKASRSILDLAEAQGNPAPTQTLAEMGLNPVKVMGKGSQEIEADAIRAKTAATSQKILAPTLQEAQVGKPLTQADDIVERALKNIPKDATPGERISIQNSIQNEGAALKSEFPQGMTYSDMQGVKGRYDANTKFGLTPDQRIIGQTNKSMGSSLRKTIEDGVGTDPVSGKNLIKEFNKVQSQQYQAADYLDSLNGKSNKPGFIRSNLRRVAGIGGAALGNAASTLTGGLVGGELPGYLIGNGLSHIFDNVSSPLKALMLRNLQTTDPAEAQALLKYIGEREANRLTQLKLPAPSELGTSRNPIITPSPTTYESPAQKITRYDRTQLALPSGEGRVNNPIITPSPTTYENPASVIRQHDTTPVLKKLPKTPPQLYQPYTPNDELPTIEMGKKPISKFKKPNSSLPIIR